MDRTPLILRLVDRSERFTRCHLWDGAFRGRTPWFNERRAIVVLWEREEGPLPRRHTLLNECGFVSCVRLDHWRLVPLTQALRELRRRAGALFMERLCAAQGD